MARGYKPALVLTFFLFALWGVGHRLYEILVPDFARAFSLSSSQLVLAQSVYSIIYLFLAVPAAIYARTFGSKAAIVFGLGSWCVGAFLFYPAAGQHAFVFLLFAAAVMSCGYIFLEIGANPIIAGMGPPETTIRRLNFAHAMYPFGVLTAFFVGHRIILSHDSLPFERLGEAVVRPYMVLGLIVLALAFIADQLRFPPWATERGRIRVISSEFYTLLARPRFLAAMAAQVGNVAARAGTWALSVWYIQAALPNATAHDAGNYLLAALIAFAAGRLIGAILMFWINPVRLLAIFAGLGLIFGTVAVTCGGCIGVYAVVASSFAVSIGYATILGIAIKDLGPLTKAGTGLIYTGAAGTAIGLTAIHLVWTMSSIQYAMLVPTLGFLGVLVFALTQKKDA